MSTEKVVVKILERARYLVGRGWPDDDALREARTPTRRDILASPADEGWAGGGRISVQSGPSACVHLYTPIGICYFGSRAEARRAWEDMCAAVGAITVADVDPDGVVRAAAKAAGWVNAYCGRCGLCWPADDGTCRRCGPATVHTLGALS